MAQPSSSSYKATLADSFLADLDDLSDNEAPFEEEADEGEDVADLDDDMEDVEALNYDDLDSVAKLQKSASFFDIMKVKGRNLDCAPHGLGLSLSCGG